MIEKPPKAPAGLGSAGKRFWQRVVAEYVLTSEHHLRLLLECSRCLDSIESARGAVARDGQFIPNRFGELREHPGVATELQCRRTFRALLRELNLDSGPGADGIYTRPPTKK